MTTSVLTVCDCSYLLGVFTPWENAQYLILNFRAHLNSGWVKVLAEWWVESTHDESRQVSYLHFRDVCSTEVDTHFSSGASAFHPRIASY